MGMNTTNGAHLIRSNMWSMQLKEILQDVLEAQKWVDWMTEFPDGTTFNIPSIGQASIQDVVEDEDVIYESLDTGNFTFQMTEYIASALSVTRKQLMDSFQAQRILGAFVPAQARAIMEKLETDIMALSAQQTAGSLNPINGANHRFVGSGTNEVITPADFAKAKFALKKAKVPMSNLIAVVDPSVSYTLETLSNLTNVSNNPQWEGVVNSGITSGNRFIKNVYGFDVYESNYLAAANETINGLTTTAGVANMFFSADQTVLPFVGAWRQEPHVDSEFNKDKQREEYITTAYYGVKLFRPDNLVCVLTDTDQV